MVPPPKPPEERKKESALPSFTMPDVKKVLQEEKLESPAFIEQTQADLKKKSDTWQQQMSSLPDKAALDAYQERIRKLKEARKGGLMGLTGAAADALELAKDLNRDLEKVKKAKTDFSADLAAAKALAEKAERSPMDDVRRVAEWVADDMRQVGFETAEIIKMPEGRHPLVLGRPGIDPKQLLDLFLDWRSIGRAAAPDAEEAQQHSAGSVGIRQ